MESNNIEEREICPTAGDKLFHSYRIMGLLHIRLYSITDIPPIGHTVDKAPVHAD